MGPRDGVQACSSLSPEGSIWDLVREAGVSGLLSGHTYLKTFFRVLWCEQRIGPCSAPGTVLSGSPCLSYSYRCRVGPPLSGHTLSFA